MAIDRAIDSEAEPEVPRTRRIPIFVDLAASDDPRALAKVMREQPVMRIGEEFTIVTRREHIESALRSPGGVLVGGRGGPAREHAAAHPAPGRPPEAREVPAHPGPAVRTSRDGGARRRGGRAVQRASSTGSRPMEPATCMRSSRSRCRAPSSCKLMGLPLEDLDQFLAMKDGIIRPPGDSMEEQEPVRKKTAQDIYEYFQMVVDERRDEPAISPISSGGSWPPSSTGRSSPTTRSWTSASCS